MKTMEAVEAYRILGDAKYQKMSDEGKIKVWKITRQLKPVATHYDEERQDASQKMMPDEDFMQRLHKAQLYEIQKKEGKETELSDEEYQKFLKEFTEYDALVKKTLQEISEKEIELKYEPLSEDDFGKLMASNDWDLKQVEKISFVSEE